MSEYVYAGLTSQTVDVYLQDSSSTTGQGLSGLVYNTSGLKAYYRKGATGTATAITLATQTVGGAYSSGGFVEIDATNMKGVYRFDIPNAAVDTAGFVTLFFYGATNLLPTALRIDCRALPANVKQFGDTAGTFASGRPEVNTTHVGGTSQTARDIGASVLLSSGTGTGQISLSSGTVTVGTNNDKTGYSLTATTGLGNQTANITGNLSGSVGSVTGNVGGNVTGSVGSISGVTFPTNFGSMSITVGGAVTAGTVSDKTGYSLTATTGLGNQTANITGNLSGSVGSVTSRVTANTDQWNGVSVTGMPMPTYTQPTGFLAATFPTTVASPTNITSASGVTLAATTHTGAVIPTVSTVTNGVTVSTNNDKTGYTLSASGLAGISTWTVDITGSLSGSVGSVGTGGITSASFATDSITATALAANAVTEIQSGLATEANQTLILDRCGYLMAQEIGACSDAGTSAETYAITINSTTYTIDHTGLDATGNRGTATLTKT